MRSDRSTPIARPPNPGSRCSRICSGSTAQRSLFGPTAWGWPGGPDWAPKARKRWADLVVEILHRHRESVDALYRSLIHLVEKASQIPEAQSSEDCPARDGGYLEQLARDREEPIREPAPGHPDVRREVARARAGRPGLANKQRSLIAVALPTLPSDPRQRRPTRTKGDIQWSITLRQLSEGLGVVAADATGDVQTLDADTGPRRSRRPTHGLGRRRPATPRNAGSSWGSSCSTNTARRSTRPTRPGSSSSNRRSAPRRQIARRLPAA